MSQHLSHAPCDNCDLDMGGATGGGEWDCPPLLGPAATGYRGQSNENDLCFYSRQSLFSTVQCD